MHAALLLGCYRKADCADPEVFATAAVAVFSRYPEDVVRKVTDPHSGLPSRSKWVPTISEIREACEGVSNAAKRREEADARVKAQFAERDRMAAMDPAERRKEFINREMEWIKRETARINALRGTGEPEEPPPPIDIREMDDCSEKDVLRRKLDAEIAALRAKSVSTPLRLSEAALRSLGISVPKQEGAA